MTSTARESNNEVPVRYVVGIDLGTTNCALSYIDLDELDSRDPEASIVHDLSIPQCVAPNIVDKLPTLPSFFSRLSSASPLPWEDDDRSDFSVKNHVGAPSKDGRFGVVGALARDYGGSEPDAFVSSAKSWLCHAHVDRLSKLLPLRDASESQSPSPRWSPVEISSFYLRHLRAAWNHTFPDYPLETQAISLTIPASFDETARALTLDAAKLAKLPRVSLVEEPQAAFYAWLERHEKTWTEIVKPGDRILVCDVGGGTTDFAIIYALNRDSQKEGLEGQKVKFYRVAVGDHLVLGGDNLDQALFIALESRFRESNGRELTARQRVELLRSSREIKEKVLSASGDPEEKFRAVILDAGARLFSGVATAEITRGEVEALLVDGFFPKSPLDAEPRRARLGLRALALPYAQDPAVTKHLAKFLVGSRNSGSDLVRAGIVGELAQKPGVDPARPDAVLFNGGAFDSPLLRRRIIDAIAEWFPSDSDKGWSPAELENAGLYLAAARGAAYYGLALRGRGERIGASLARTYYAEVALDAGAREGQATIRERRTARKGVCILPAQAEPGDTIELDRVFDLEVDKPVSFPLHVSSVRTTDAPGDLVVLDPLETRELSPIRTALRTRSAAKKAAGRVKARLVARPTEIGTIELFLKEEREEKGGRGISRWTLQFDARGAVESDWEEQDASGEASGVEDDTLIERGFAELESTFSAFTEKPGTLFRRLGEALGEKRENLGVMTLRRLAEKTFELRAGRSHSAAHEARWLNWLGYALRPGFGASADDWRVEQAWKELGNRRLTFRSPEVTTQYWIFWRRVASGLASGRQNALGEPLLSQARSFHKQLVEGRGRGAALEFTTQEGAEIWRLLGALELLPVESRIEIGNIIADVLDKKSVQPVRDALVWSLGRVGARRLFHAPLDRVTPSEFGRRWAERLLDSIERRGEAPTSTECFALAQLTREAEDARFDVPRKTRETVASFLLKHGAEESTLAALERSGRLVDEATSQAFGEALPLGLRWN